MAWQNQDLNNLFLTYRGRTPTQQEWNMYGNAPREALLADLQGPAGQAYQYGQSQQEIAQRLDNIQQQIQAGTASPEAIAEMRSLAEQEYNPYYERIQKQQQEDLDYVLQQIQTGKIRSKEDLNSALRDIAQNEMYQEKTYGLRKEGLTAQQTAFERQAPQQMRQLQQGYSNRGLLYSGERDIGQGNLEFGQQQQREGYTRQAQDLEAQRQQQQYATRRGREQAQQSYQRGMQDYGTQASRYQTQYGRQQADTARQRTYDVQSYMDKERQRRERDIYQQQSPEYYSNY